MIFSGNLYYFTDNSGTYPITSFRVEADNGTEARRMILDEHWDSRLDSSGCVPCIVFDDAEADNVPDDSLVDRWLEEHKFYNFEGERGLERLNEFCSALGYDESGFQFGSPLEEFLQDNPGAIEALLDWVREQGCFADKLTSG